MDGESATGKKQFFICKNIQKQLFNCSSVSNYKKNKKSPKHSPATNKRNITSSHNMFKLKHSLDGHKK